MTVVQLMYNRRTVWDLPEIRQYKADWDARIRAFERLQKYYDGSQYDKTVLGHDPRMLEFYEGIKPIYVLLHRAVDVMAGLIPGGWLPARQANIAQRAAIAKVLRDSKWSTEGVLYPHYGALYGQAILRVIDRRDQGRVAIQVCDPRTCMLVGSGIYDETPAMAITVQTAVDEKGAYEYAEIITPDWVRTFRDGALHGFDGRPAAYENALGFVPFVASNHKNTGKPLGENTFERVISMLDEINDLASNLADAIRKHSNPQWVVIGAQVGEIMRSDDTIWELPHGAEVRAVIGDVDIEAALSFVKDVKSEMRDALPELAYDALKGASQVATATVEMQLGELVIKVNRCRPNYDYGLAQALQMAGRAAAGMGLTELAVLDDETLTLDSERETLPRDEMQRLMLRQMAIAVQQQENMLGGA